MFRRVPHRLRGRIRGRHGALDSSEFVRRLGLLHAKHASRRKSGGAPPHSVLFCAARECESADRWSGGECNSATGLLLFVDADGLAGGAADYGVAEFAVVAGVEASGHFAADEVDEGFHLGLHFAHFVAHVEDDFDTGQVDA